MGRRRRWWVGHFWTALCSDTQGPVGFKLHQKTRHKSPHPQFRTMDIALKPATQLNLENLLPFAFAFSLYGLGSLPGWRTPFDLKSQANERRLQKAFPETGKGKGKESHSGKEN